MSRTTPSPVLLTSLLPMKPATRPRTIQARIDIFMFSLRSYSALSASSPLVADYRNGGAGGLPKWLPNLNLESVFMAIPEVFLPPTNIHFHKRNIRPVLLHQVRTVLTIFAVVPIMIVAVVPIAIALFTKMVVSHHATGATTEAALNTPPRMRRCFMSFNSYPRAGAPLATRPQPWRIACLAP